MRIGILAGISAYRHETNLPIIMDLTDCGNYDKGQSVSFNAGINFSRLLLKDYVWADLRLIYRSVPVNFEKSDSRFQVFNPKNQNYEDLVIKHSFDTKFDYLSIEPGFIFQYKEFPFKFHLYFDLGFPVTSVQFESTDEIVSPKTFNFPDNTSKHITQEGKISDQSYVYGTSAGLIYERKLSENILFSAELAYRYSLNSALTSYVLNISHLSLNAGLQFAFKSKREEKKVIPLPLPIDTPKIEIPIEKAEPVIVKSEPVLSVSAGKLDAVETIVTQTYPILPYIFFDSSSYQLKEKYIQARKASLFTEDQLPNETLKIYYALLEIIASRMANNPDAKLVIQGMSDGRESDDLENRMILAEKRAKTVASYFLERWNMDSSRITIKTRETPELKTSTQYDEGFEENRRVELYSDNFEIMKPVIFSRFKEYKLDSDSLTINYNLKNSNEVSNFRISLASGDDDIIPDTGINDSSGIRTFKLNYEQKEIISRNLAKNRNTSIYASYEYDGKTITNKYDIDINKQENNFELGRLNLIVFDFDKSEINNINKELIKNFVVNSINDDSKVIIIGSTDRLGEKDYNMELSKLRAESSFKFIKSLKPKANFVEIDGIGDSRLLYDNDLPEGRFYCRTVLIEVTSPVK